MKIFAKSNFKKEEILHKKELGCDGIELNLEEDFNQYTKAQLDKTLSALHIKDLYVIHAPKTTKINYMTMEDIVLGGYQNGFKNCFYLAEKIAKIYNHRVLIVIHCTLSYFDFTNWKYIREQATQMLTDLFFQYPEVDLAIENVICVEERDGKSFRLTNGTMLDTVNIVEYFRYLFGDRVGSVLDLCHAKISNMQWNALLNTIGYPQDYTIEDYFSINKGICKLIHFNNMRNNGYGKDHGIGFDSDEEVKELLSYYEKYHFTCPLTLEIREDDYNNCINYKETKERLDRLIKDKNAANITKEITETEMV